MKMQEKQGILRFLHFLSHFLFPRAMRKIAMLAWIFDECREGQIPRPLGRCKIDTPLLAAGSLIVRPAAHVSNG